MDLNVIPLIPEMFVAGAACLILLLDLFLSGGRRRDVVYGFAVAALVVAVLLVLQRVGSAPATVLNGMFIDDPFARVMKIAICGVSLLVFLYSRTYAAQRGIYHGEYFVLGLFGVVGMMVMASAAHFLVLYLGLELLSLSLYAMVAFQRDSSNATEAAMKYFVLGAIGSGMLLYGMSLLYGLTGSLEIIAVRHGVAALTADNMILLLGVVFVIVSLAFKIGAVPFHMWVPDVYHGAPTTTTLFISTAPKLAGFAIIMRLLIGGLEDVHGAWRDMITVIAVGSIAVGNLTAIMQTNFKRMLAYSAISHMGFMLLGVLAGTATGYSAAMFYSLVYALMSLGGFGMVLLLSRSGYEADEISDLRGLNQRNPWYAFLLLLVMVSMAGVPPTIGFMAKFYVIWSVVETGLIWLAVLAVLFAAVGAYYYLRVVWYMYFEPSPDGAQYVDPPRDLRVLLGINACAMVLLLPFIGPIQQVCIDAIAAVLGAFNA